MSEIPDFYKKLLVSPGAATLSVVSKDGSIQSSLLWPDYDGEFIKLNMTQGAANQKSIERLLFWLLMQAMKIYTYRFVVNFTK